MLNLAQSINGVGYGKSGFWRTKVTKALISVKCSKVGPN